MSFDLNSCPITVCSVVMPNFIASSSDSSHPFRFCSFYMKFTESCSFTPEAMPL